MTIKELAELLGTTVRVDRGGLIVDCTILDVKQSYGSTRYLVAPVSGSGSVWVETFAPIVGA